MAIPGIQVFLEQLPHLGFLVLVAIAVYPVIVENQVTPASPALVAIPDNQVLVVVV